MKRLIFLLALVGVTQIAFAQDDIITEEGLKAYEKTLFPALRASCVQCHGDGGMAIGHSVADSREAYLNSKQLVDFTSIENSRFVAKVKAKHWLRHDPNAKGMEPEAMIAYLQGWWNEGESRANSKFEAISTRVEIPANLPEMKDLRFVTLNWNLNTDRANLGCTASVDIQRAKFPTETVPGSYRVKNPKMKCRGQDVEIQSVYYAISDEIRQYENIYSTVKMTIPKNGEEKMLSNEIMILVQRETKDTITMLIRKATIKTE
jgi:hypothetical protein